MLVLALVAGAWTARSAVALPGFPEDAYTDVYVDTNLPDAYMSDVHELEIYEPDVYDSDTVYPDTFIDDADVYDSDTVYPDTFIDDVYVPDVVVPDTNIDDIYLPDVTDPCLTTDCDDGDACTVDDCLPGIGCEHYSIAEYCETLIPAGFPDEACVMAYCDPAQGCVVVNTSGSCDDGDPCTEGDACQDGACVGGTYIDCDDGDACTKDDCDFGGCSHYPMPDLGGCDDGSECTTDGCDPATGDCYHIPDDALCPDDNNPCTTVGCDHMGGCVVYFNEGSCDDGDPCTEGDTCSAGMCGGTPMECDDDNPCTDDACVDGACEYTPNSEPCDDGYVCTENDACADGQCSGEDKVCDDGIDCTQDSCEEPDGCRYGPDSAYCTDDDNNVCTEAVCDPANGDPGTGCGYVAVDGSCDDGDVCTEGDECVAGECQPGPMIDCDDGSECTDDSCDPSEGCQHDIAEGKCTECEEQISVPPIKVGMSFSMPATTKCPGFFGGSAGVTVNISGSGTKKFPSCPECESSFAVQASGSVAVTACKELGATVEIGGGYKGTTVYCPECNDDTCKLECGDVSCDKEEFSGFTKVTITRFMGYQSKISTGKVGPIPSISLLAKCGVNLGLAIGAKAAWSEDTPGECEACTQCEKESGTFSLGGTAAGGCYFRLSMFKGSVTLGCKDCATLGLTFAGSGQKQKGACGAGGCFTASVTGTAGAKLPCWDVGFWWFKSAVRCGIGATGTCKGGTCGPAGCGVDNVYASCSVRRGGCK